MLSQIENQLGEKIVSSNSLGGGCIADSKKILTESGKQFFLKSYSSKSKILKNEANGLLELTKANAIRIPKVEFLSDNYLLLEFITTGSKKKDFSEIFARQFADLHKFSSAKFGFYEDNFIGSTLQKNLPRYENWVDFYFNNRLLFQYKLAERNGYSSSELKKLFGNIENRIQELLEPSLELPSLLHGDLWGGNYMVDEHCNPVLIDPAVYYGHREADLAMTMLFGGFDGKFYSAYDEYYPLPLGWQERVNIYKLYHILNHLNIFGSGYYSQAISLLKYYS